MNIDSEVLIKNPLYRKDDLGKPIPGEHGVSVCLPTWKDNIDYEEGNQRIINSLNGGYPRFVLHPLILRLVEEVTKRFAKNEEKALIFPSESAAQRAKEYMIQHGVETIRCESLENSRMRVLIFPEKSYSIARQFWQHAGEIVTSREASSYLSGSIESKSQHELGIQAAINIKNRISSLTLHSPEDIYLFPTGMAAIHQAYRITKLLPTNSLRGYSGSAQVGFSYVDTQKIQERFSSGYKLFADPSESEYSEIESLAKNGDISAIFCETPSNPLLKCVNLPLLRQIADLYHIPIIVDETLGGFLNIDVSPYADIFVTSLTKYFSGASNVMGGSLIVSKYSKLRQEILELLSEDFQDICYWEDLTVLAENASDYESRMRKINSSAEQLVDMLSRSSVIDSIYYPTQSNIDNYRRIMKPGNNGFGGLFSITFKEGESAAAVFYDAIQISKGPSLGADFTLGCPYTLLAHYGELEKVRAFGIRRDLVRIAVGCEDYDVLDWRFKEGLNAISSSN